MSRARQRRTALRKAFKGIGRVQCYSPNKICYSSLRQARAAARAQGYREYQCGDHYHLTSSPVIRLT